MAGPSDRMNGRGFGQPPHALAESQRLPKPEACSGGEPACRRLSRLFNIEYRRQLAGLEGAPDGPHREEEEGGEAYQIEVEARHRIRFSFNPPVPTDCHSKIETAFCSVSGGGESYKARGSVWYTKINKLIVLFVFRLYKKGHVGAMVCEGEGVVEVASVAPF